MRSLNDDDAITVSTRPRFTAHVTRDGRWWRVAVPEIDGLTQARRLSEAGTMARELVALVLDVAPDTFDLTISIDSVGTVDVRDRLAEIEHERAEAADLERRLARHTRSLARDLAALDVSQRDIGTILGVSHQRAHQLLASSS